MEQKRSDEGITITIIGGMATDGQTGEGEGALRIYKTKYFLFTSIAVERSESRERREERKLF